MENEKEKIELRNAIESWRVLQEEFMPDVIKLASSQMGPYPEMDTLFLPLQLPAEFEKYTWYKQLAHIERGLCQGQAADALEGLRESLQLQELLLVGKSKGAAGNKSNTRAQGYVNRSSAHVHHFKDAYNSCRAAMIRLGMKDDDSLFPKLTATDTRIKTLTGWKATGEGKTTDSWIWTHSSLDKNSAEWKKDSEFTAGIKYIAC